MGIRQGTDSVILKVFFGIVPFQFPEQVGIFQFFRGVFVLMEFCSVLVAVFVGETLDTEVSFVDGNDTRDFLGKIPIEYVVGVITTTCPFLDNFFCEGFRAVLCKAENLAVHSELVLVKPL